MYYYYKCTRVKRREREPENVRVSHNSMYYFYTPFPTTSEAYGPTHLIMRVAKRPHYIVQHTAPPEKHDFLQNSGHVLFGSDTSAQKYFFCSILNTTSATTMATISFIQLHHRLQFILLGCNEPLLV